MIPRPCLRKVKARAFKKKIYGFDIETKNNNKEFLCASIWGDDYYEFFKDKQSMIEAFKQPRFYDSYVVATNLGFDFFGLFDGTDADGKFDTLFRGSGLIYAKTYINKHGFFQRRKSNGRLQSFPLSFIDTGNYAMMSVEKLGEVIGINKLEKPLFLGKEPKNKQEWAILERYNARDSEISCKFIKFLFKTLSDYGCTPKLTLASTAMNLFKAIYLGETRYYRMPEDIIKKCFRAYYGGRTEVFARGTDYEVTTDDYNSLYPSIAAVIDLPDPNSFRVNRINSLHYITNYTGCATVRVYCPEMMYPLLPYRRADGKVIFPTGTFEGTYTNLELIEALRLGYKILEVKENVWFKDTCKPLKQYMLDMYERRNKHKAEGSPLETVDKLLMNGLTGKFGQKFENKDNWITSEISLDELQSYDKFERHGNYFRVVKTTEPAAFCIPIWIAYITAAGRIKITADAARYQARYIDTDCVHVKNKNIPTGEGLGEFKKEHFYEIIHYVRPKMYGGQYRNKEGVLCDDVKIKGLGVKMSFKDFSNALSKPVWNEKKDCYVIKKTYDKFTKFKESKRRGFYINELREVEKELSLEDDKRDWLQKFTLDGLEWSTPVHLTDGYTEKERAVMMRKAMEAYKDVKVKETREYLASDLFDSYAVGSDISKEEFLENERWWGQRGEEH